MLGTIDFQVWVLPLNLQTQHWGKGKSAVLHHCSTNCFMFLPHILAAALFPRRGFCTSILGLSKSACSHTLFIYLFILQNHNVKIIISQKNILAFSLAGSWRGGVTFSVSRWLIAELTYRDRQPFTLTPTVNLELPIYPKHIRTVGGSQREHSQ